MKNFVYLSLFGILLLGCKSNSSPKSDHPVVPIVLDLVAANKLAKLPIKCIHNPLPYKSGIIIADASDLVMPQEHHPAFYGCFDWHSAVHGHWSLVYLLKEFDQLDSRDLIRSMLSANLTADNIRDEIKYFSLNKYTQSFERTYGWAWLLKLQEELYTWDDPMAQQCYVNLQPLASLISEKYQEYLPKLVYPIRVGEHSNTAFGLSFAYDYAITIKDHALKTAIEEHAKRFFNKDQNCPISWEPSGYDFLSPCLSEMTLMKKILNPKEFDVWSNRFFNSLKDQSLDIAPAEIRDRSDGKLVHLDGLNFSRAWCLYPMAEEYPGLVSLADQHLQFSLNNIADGDYSGEHWLASFALYALKTRKETVDAIK